MFCFADYKCVRKVDSTTFEFVHKEDERRNHRVEMEVLDDEKRVEWDDMPAAAGVDLENFDFKMKRNKPLESLNLILREQTDQELGVKRDTTRLPQEYHQVQVDKINISQVYELEEEIGKGATGSVFLAKHKEENKQYALKLIEKASA